MTKLSPTRLSLRRYQIAGMTGLFVVFGSVTAWAFLSPIHGAIIAPGVTVVELSVKKVQYPDGGIVAQIYVKEGDRVKAGDKLVRMDETQLHSELQIVKSILAEYRAQHARLIAQRDDADKVTFPADLESRRSDSMMAEILSGQEKLFMTQKASITGRRISSTSASGSCTSRSTASRPR